MLDSNDSFEEVDHDEDRDECLYEHRRFDSASCLPYGSEVIVQFCNPQTLTSLSVQPRGNSSASVGGGPATSRSRVCFVANEAHRQLGGIGQHGENRFVLARDAGSSSGASASGLGRLDERDVPTTGQFEEDAARDFLCYGDKIMLHSRITKRVLGVQKEKAPVSVVATAVEGADGRPANKDNDAGGRQLSHGLEVGCFRREGRFPQANQWTVLRGGAHAPVVQLGSMHNRRNSKVTAEAEERERRVPVYSGDPIVLRNEWAGGLLSLGDEYPPLSSAGCEDGGEDVAFGWSLDILTSSYQMNKANGGGASTEGDRTLIEYLQEHNQCRPRAMETFQIFAADTPSCPSWSYAGADRIYLLNSYLSCPSRHDGIGDQGVEAAAFPEPRNGEPLDRQRPEAGWPTLAELTVDAQEKVLLDEVIGAMMGHEGQFIRYHPSELVLKNPEEEREEGNEPEERHLIMTEPQFGLASAAILGGNIDASLENIVSRILPLCTHFVYVNQYVSSCLNHYECGVIARTLCEAIGKLLEEYLAFVSSLDYLSHEPLSANNDNALTMSMAYFRTQPSIRIMAILGHIVSTVRGKKGGELLNSLYNVTTLNYSGDEKANELLQHLLAKCAAPYANMLQSWLKAGKVHDPHGEFMIEVTNKSLSHITVKQGVEWTDWCREREQHVLDSLHDSINMDSALTNNALGVDRSRATSHMSSLHKAHATGKYWRAIHCCGDGAGATLTQQDKMKEMNGSTEEDKAKMLLNPLKLSRCIDQAYHGASATLLHMLLHEYDVLSSLRFMKKYFLLDQGDFFVDFLDGAEDELHKELPKVLRGRVQNWLTTSIARTSESSPLATTLRCTFQNKSLRDTLDDLVGRRNSRKSSLSTSRKNSARQKVLAGFEAIAFEFKTVPFPTSIVLRHDQLRIYQLIFRLIFFAKFVERQLVAMWLDHQLLKAMTSLRSACSPTFSLRCRMLHFIQNFVYYVSVGSGLHAPSAGFSRPSRTHAACLLSVRR